MSTIIKIQNLAKSKGITQAYLCTVLGKRRTYLNEIAHGKGRLSRKDVEQIAEALDTTVEFLLDDSAEQEKPRSKGVKIPVFASIAAGIPIEAIEDIVDYEEITEAMAKDGEYFGLQIKGNSMEPRMTTGDVVIIRRQSDVESGQVAAVLINGNEATLKKVIKTNTGIALISFNETYQPMNFSKKQVEQLPITILGRAVEIRGKL